MKNSNNLKQETNSFNNTTNSDYAWLSAWVFFKLLFISFIFLSFNTESYSQITQTNAGDLTGHWAEREKKDEKTNCDCWYKPDQPFVSANLSEMARNNPVRVQITEGCDKNDCGGSCSATALGRTVSGRCVETTAASGNRLSNPNTKQTNNPSADEATMSELIELLNNNIDVYPNPFSDQLNIRMNQDGVYDIELYDLAGRSVKRVSQVEGQDLTLNRDNLPAGSYILTIRSKNFINRKNVIIK